MKTVVTVADALRAEYEDEISFGLLLCYDMVERSNAYKNVRTTITICNVIIIMHKAKRMR